MKKPFLAALALFCLSYTGLAQVDERTFILSADPQVSFPLGDFKETNKLGLGGALKAQFAVGSKTRITASLGGGTFQGKDYEMEDGYTDKYPAIAFAQLKAGARYFVVGPVFVAGEAGLAHAFQKGSSEIGFTYSPSLGFEFGNFKYFNLSVKYEAVTIKNAGGKSMNFVGIALGYHI